ncbi:MAG: ASKHA domain-containing protein, partial [Candidatus Bathyarchaeia archaeon]
VSRKPIVSKAAQLGLAINPGAYVYCLPNVSRYVGGDAIGDLLASGLCDANEIGVLIDMGTNGEILLGSKGWAFSCSCASGPAFEGWEIRHGMRAVTGAVEHVTIDPETLRASYTVIGGPGVKPKGICGSGLIDAAAQMLLTGILDRWGNLRPQANNSLVRQGPDGFEYLLVPAEESALGWDIVVTQRDIRNLLESKAAVCAGVAVLMKKVGATIMDVKSLYLAGAFGNYLDPRNGAVVGVFPEFPRAEVHKIGNGSVAGAYLTLVSREQRRKAAALAQTTTYFDLSADPDFGEEYDAALTLPGRKELFPSIYSLLSRPPRGRSKEETEDLLSLLLGRT